MGLLDGNYEDERLTKKVKPAIQGGGYNYLGKQETVTVPKRWLSDPDHVVAELAYITPREAKVLLDLNLYGSLDGKPNNAPGGLPSLQGDMGSVGGGESSGGDGDGGGRGRTDSQSQYGGTTGYDSSQNQSGRNENTSGDNGGSGYSNSNQDDARLDYITGKYLDLTLTPEQKKDYSDYRENVSESIAPSTKTSSKIISGLLSTTLFPGAGNLYNSYIDATAMGYSVPNPFEGLFDGGNITPESIQNFQAQGGGGDGGDGGNNNFSNIFSNIIKQMTPDSQVNQYFANLGTSSQSPLSSSLETSYNTAKANINSILGMTPTNQQFGYSQAPYGLLSSTNMADNPFNIPYLQQRGLI
jgi:hypothetical protein